ncbi:MAG: radical SAM protein [Candidatus Omnitrophota bacterium]
MYKKVLLINPSVAGSYLGPIRPPASLGYIAEYLAAHSIAYDVIDMRLGYRVSVLWRKIESVKPDLIGVPIWSYRYKETYNFIHAIKQRYPAIAIASGGPHVSTLRKEVLKGCPEIDFGVVLEGENTLVELCQGREPSSIKGLLYRDAGEVVYTGERNFTTELDGVPFPKYDKFELNKYLLKEILVISSRGCPFDCIYCPVSLAMGKVLRTRSAENVVDEIEYWYNKNYRQFNFGDDNFTFVKDRVHRICDEIQKRGLRNLDLRCGNGIRADKVDKALLTRMREVGFTYIGIGVEAGNNRVLDSIKKHERIEHIEQAIQDACGLGYDVTLFFLAGSPDESLSDINDSITLAQKYPVFDARFYNIIPYPGTELFDWLSKNNYFLRNYQDYLNDASVFLNRPLFTTPQLDVAQRIDLFRRLRRVENAILRKTIKRKMIKHKIIGFIAAYILTSSLFRYLIRHNKYVRNMIEWARYKFSSSKLKAL